MANRKLFVPQLVPSKDSPMGPQFVAHVKGKASSAISQAIPGNMSKGSKDAIAGYLVGVAADAAAGYIANNPPKMAGPKMNNNNNRPTPAPGGLVVFTQRGSTPQNDSYALSKAPNPKPISLNSGVKTNAYSNDWMIPVEGVCAPMHASIIGLQLPTNALNPLASYIQNTLCFDIQTRAQANVEFALDVVNNLSATKLIAAFNASIAALQVYYYYASVLSYESNTRNKNSAMIDLRNKIDSQTLSALTRLGRRLEDTPIPPRIVQWVRYMNGNWLSGNSQGSPLLKLVIDPAILTTGNSSAFIDSALNTLTTDANNVVFTLLRRAIPQWRVGTLYDVPTQPTFDQNFLTIFANLPSTNRPAATTVRMNTVASSSTIFTYNSWTNYLDGVASTMCSAYSATADYLPGLTVPSVANSTNIDSRLSYYSVSGVKGWYPVVNIPFLALSRSESFIAQSAVISTPHLFGTDKLQGVCGDALLQSAQNTVDFLFNIDSIPRKGSLNSFNGRSNGPKNKL